MKTVIKVENMDKYFKIYYDRAKTLQERLIFWNRTKKKSKYVLRDIDFEIKQGETVALIGINGSGKSTLLKLLSRIIYPNKGSITTNGKIVSLLELGAGFHPDFTGRENIYFNASIFGFSHKEIEARVNDIIEFSELGTAIDEPIRTYSSGMYMRLAFSIATSVDADIFLIDEILAVGDQHFQEKCLAKMIDLVGDNKTLVFVTHDAGTVKKFCKRAIWLKEGRIEMDDTSDKVIEAYQQWIREAYK